MVLDEEISRTKIGNSDRGIIECSEGEIAVNWEWDSARYVEGSRNEDEDRKLQKEKELHGGCVSLYQRGYSRGYQDSGSGDGRSGT